MKKVIQLIKQDTTYRDWRFRFSLGEKFQDAAELRSEPRGFSSLKLHTELVLNCTGLDLCHVTAEG